MSFCQLVQMFLRSRGGLVALAAVVAMVTRLVLWPLEPRDLVIASAIVLAWPAIEYTAHRWFMHEWIWTPFRSTHDRHHADPTPETGLPDLWVVLMYFANSGIFALTTPGLFTAHAVVLSMLLWYEFVHYSCHTSYRPRTWWGWAVRANHLGHHSSDHLLGQYSMLFPIWKKNSKA